jgi:hypothetical protein
MGRPSVNQTPPRAAWWLGLLGIVPFFALALAAWIGGERVALAASRGVAAYGAVILSFIGGAHWGFASVASRNGHASPDVRLLAVSVLPSLCSWAALLLPLPWCLAMLGIGFAAVLIIDRWATRVALAPEWWIALRRPLSAAVAALLLLVLLALVVRFGGAA